MVRKYVRLPIFVVMIIWCVSRISRYSSRGESSIVLSRSKDSRADQDRCDGAEESGATQSGVNSACPAPASTRPHHHTNLDHQATTSSEKDSMAAQKTKLAHLNKSSKRRYIGWNVRIYFGVVGILLVVSVVAFLYSSLIVYQVERGSSGPFCIGVECQGKNPDGTNCKNDAQNLLSKPVYDSDSGVTGTLTLKHSQNCQANWVRWSGSSGDAGVLNNPQIWPKDGSTNPVGIADQFNGPSSGTDTWSGMISDKGDTCIDISFSRAGKTNEADLYFNGLECTESLVGSAED